MYIVHKPVVKFSGASQNSFLEISQNLMVLYKTIHKAFRIHKTLKNKQNPLEIFFYF